MLACIVGKIQGRILVLTEELKQGGSDDCNLQPPHLRQGMTPHIVHII